MRDVALRAQKDRLLTPLAESFFAAVHPNVVSVLAFTVGALAAVAVLRHAYLLGLGLWITNRVLDGLDGLVARTHAKQSDFGGYLDLLLDYLVYLLVPISFVAADPAPVNLWAVLLLISSYVLNAVSWIMLSALLEKRRMHSVGRLTSIEMPAGLIEGAETILFYMLFYFVPAHIAVAFAVMALLVFFTAGQRVVWAYRHLA